MNWREVEIGNLVELRQGLCINKKSNHLVADTGLPLLRITDMINQKHSVFIKEEVPVKYIAKYDDIIYSRTGQVGLVFRHQFGVLFNNCFTVTPISDELSRDYLYWFLRCDETKKMANDYASGAAQLDLSHSAFKCIKIKYPIELTTQRKIASILSAYDDLIENNLKRIKLLEEKAFLSYKLIVKSEKLDEFSIEEVCETIGGGTPATGNRQFWDDGDVLWFSPTDLTKHNSFVLLDSEKKITELGLQKSSSKLLPPKTILMTSRASIGYFGLINKPASTNQGFINIIPFKKYHLAYMLFNLKNRKEEIIGNANGSTFLEISKGKFRQMKIKLPSNDKVLQIFEAEFDIVFNLIENLLKQNSKLREARDILLPRLMSGVIEV